MPGTVRSYYQLAKPGIVYGNTLHVGAAALFATAFSGLNLQALIGVLIGTALIIASACVVNCITDRSIDAKMERTKKRPLPSGRVSVRGAIVYAIILGIAGSLIILVLANVIALGWALVGHVTYTVMYGYAKRHTWMGTIVGTIPGAAPVLAGYAAIDPSLPPVAWLLALVILLWQLPHFYALSLYRRDDYAKSGMPLLSVVKSRETVVRHIIVTGVLYVMTTVVLLAYMQANRYAGALLFIAAFAWVASVIVAKNRGTDAWARKVFGTSLYMPMAFFAASLIAVAMR